MISTLSTNVVKQDNDKCNTHNNVGNTVGNEKMTTIDVKRLEHLLAIEKNYIQIIAHGVQSTITSTTKSNKK